MSHEIIYIDAYNTNAGSFLKDYDWYESLDPKKKYPKTKVMNKKNYNYCILEFYDKKYMVMERCLDDKEKAVLSNYCQCTFCLAKWDEHSPGLLTVNLNDCLKGLYPAQWNIKQAEILLSKKIVANNNPINSKNHEALAKLQKLFQTPIKITVNDINSLTDKNTIKKIDLQIKTLELIEPKKEPKIEPVKHVKPPKKLIKNYRKTRPENIPELFQELERATNKIPIKFSPSHTFLLIKLFNCLNDKYYELRGFYEIMKTLPDYEYVLNEANSQKAFLETVINTVNKFGVLNLSVNFIILKNNAEIIIRSTLHHKERTILMDETNKLAAEYQTQIKIINKLLIKDKEDFKKITIEVQKKDLTIQKHFFDNYLQKIDECSTMISDNQQKRDDLQTKMINILDKEKKYIDEEQTNKEEQHIISEKIIKLLKEKKTIYQELISLIHEGEKNYIERNKIKMQEWKQLQK